MTIRQFLCFVQICVIYSQGVCSQAVSQDIELKPIYYMETEPVNDIQVLINDISSGKRSLKWNDQFGYLPSLLQELKVDHSSQVLVFSKTSLQRSRISPRTPRAIYFNDEVYVGYCQDGEVLELSAADAKLGTVFYTLNQEEELPQFKRHYDHCIVCHGSTQNHGYPGHTVRSLYVDRSGDPVYHLGTDRVDHRTPFSDRWGGWYVTGTHGKQQHRGNMLTSPMVKNPPEINANGLNVTLLNDFFKTSNYLTSSSDLVALMVLEHQTEGHNRITRLNFETQIALEQQAEFDRILDRPQTGLTEGTASRINSAAKALVEYFLYCEEALLNEPIAGTTSYQEEFAAKSVKDKLGRSLRDFDLKSTLFKFPLSYLIYTPEFDALPTHALNAVYTRLGEVLSSPPDDKKYHHLTIEKRIAVYEIVGDTKVNLPTDWKEKYQPH